MTASSKLTTLCSALLIALLVAPNEPLVFAGISGLVSYAVTRSDDRARIAQRVQAVRDAREEAICEHLEALASTRAASLRVRRAHPGAFSVFGRYSGVPVQIALEGADTPGPLACTLLARMQHPLPAGTRITLRGAEHPAGIRLGDPVLDGALYVETADADALRATLSKPGLRGDLLGVIHRWPGSEITARQVVLRREIDRIPGTKRTPGGPDLAALAESMAAAAALAERLGG